MSRRSNPGSNTHEDKLRSSCPDVGTLSDNGSLLFDTVYPLDNGDVT